MTAPYNLKPFFVGLFKFIKWVYCICDSPVDWITDIPWPVSSCELIIIGSDAVPKRLIGEKLSIVAELFRLILVLGSIIKFKPAGIIKSSSKVQSPGLIIISLLRLLCHGILWIICPCVEYKNSNNSLSTLVCSIELKCIFWFLS